MKTFRNFLICLGLLLTLQAEAQIRLSYNQGHSHNDYHQQIPLINAYHAGMGSIEADIFVSNGELCVAHDSVDISNNLTLKKMYLDPLADFYMKSGNKPYPDPRLNLQLVIDIKANHKQVLPILIRELKAYQQTFNSAMNSKAIRIVVSGNMPAPHEFKNYPEYIFFDGRPYIEYTKEQLKRVAMISDDLKKYTKWKGIGMLPKTDLDKLRALVKQAKKLHKPFRFWATVDNPNTWTVLEQLGVGWINTDHPEKLKQFYLHKNTNM
ncbi:phosphatidylinositol-specific phospholipase C/glycerophosphodiester phosphodiesterase family protein [Pedobacter immunditicola]|uniref:phosphatidylinositol-specific phospholipase C/glycerophosphodiester phosphodiesterase family protein n=1 Tax=Pedobacter immunditicola TaxID=3133440 RepID=UPI0030A0E9BA